MRVKDDSVMAESGKYRVVTRDNSRTGLPQSSLGHAIGAVTCCVSILCTVAEGRGICRCLRPFSCLVMRLRPVQEVWRCHQERRALVSPNGNGNRGRLQPRPRPLNCPSRHQNRSALIIANRLTAGNHVLLGMWCQRRVVRVGVRGKVSVSRRSTYHVWWSAMSSGFAFCRF